MPKKESKERRANGDGSFYARPDGTIQFRATIGRDKDGKPIRKPFYGKSQAECRRKYKTFLKKQEVAIYTISPDITLRDWSLEYLVSCRKDSGIKLSSYRQLELLRDKIPDKLMKKKVSEIKQIELQAFLNEYAKTASKSYVDKMFSLVRNIFAEAVENDVCLKNPARKLKRPQKREKPRGSYQRAEVEEIMLFALSYRRHTKSDQLNRGAILVSTAVITLLDTGIRRGELLGLMPPDVEDTVLHIRRGVYLGDDGVPTVDDGVAKTYASIRDVPIDKELADLIRAVPRRGLYIFSAYSGRIMYPRNFNRAYDAFFRAFRAAHPEMRRLSVHCCRHTFATLSQRGGANIRSVQMVLGHTSIETTAKYTHPNDDDLAVAGEAFRDYIRPKQDQAAGDEGKK